MWKYKETGNLRFFPWPISVKRTQIVLSIYEMVTVKVLIDKKIDR